jgi:hypothetical protein
MRAKMTTTYVTHWLTAASTVRVRTPSRRAGLDSDTDSRQAATFAPPPSGEHRHELPLNFQVVDFGSS